MPDHGGSVGFCASEIERPAGPMRDDIRDGDPMQTLLQDIGLFGVHAQNSDDNHSGRRTESGQGEHSGFPAPEAMQ